MKSTIVSKSTAKVSTLLLISLLACQKTEKSQSNTYITTHSGLQYKVLREGTGPLVKDGQDILLHEKMFYQNDSLLFDSHTLPVPVQCRVGASQVIAGIDEALPGMKQGEIKRIIVPPALSKRTGEHTFPHPDSTLVYEIEIVEILE